MSSTELKRALEAKLIECLQELPRDLLQMKMRDFLLLSQLESNSLVPASSAKKRSASSSSASSLFLDSSRPSVDFCLPETPKTATKRRANHHDSISHSATPSVRQSARKAALMTPRAFNPLLPQTPANHAANIASKRPRLTIIKSSATPAKPGNNNENHEPNDEIVQFQLQSGKVVDVDFSRSPRSALAEANLMESADALQEVKAKIETYASHFMQYLKFFKKLQPTKSSK